MSVDEKNRIQIYRETMPFLEILVEAFQKNEKLPRTQFKQLCEIAEVLKPSSEEEQKRWRVIVGDTDYDMRDNAKYDTALRNVSIIRR